MEQTLQQAALTLGGLLKETPQAGIILGSGLGGLADKLTAPVIIPYSQVPGMKVSTAPGHAGRFVAGHLGGKYVLCMQGRLHFYEGHTMGDIVFPVRLMKLLGVETLIVTNACGAVNRDFAPGDLCLITDHINLLGTNPMIGPNLSSFGPRFFDMSEAYNPGLRSLALECGKELGISLRQGVYLAYTGPSYETPAEIRAFRVLGADLVGMSTVPEVIAAHHCGLHTLAIGLVTNMAAGVSEKKLSEQEVIDTAAAKALTLEALVERVISRV